MKLYYAETMNPRKACAVACYLKSPVEFVHVDLGKGEHHRPDFLAINPNGKVPALLDGQHSLWESNAIMGYLARQAGSDLWPDDQHLIDLMRWLSWDLEHFSRYTGTLYFEFLIKPHFGIGGADAGQVAEATGYFRKYATVLNDHLSTHDYLVCDRLTIADFAVAITLPYASQAHIPLGDFLAVARWHDRLNELDAWRHPFPHRASAAA